MSYVVVVVVVVVCALYGYFGRYYERMVGRGGDFDSFRDEEVGDDHEGDREEETVCGWPLQIFPDLGFADFCIYPRSKCI